MKKERLQILISGILITLLAIRSIAACKLSAIDYVLLIGTPIHFVWMQATK